jgi:hypothetical protein
MFIKFSLSQVKSVASTEKNINKDTKSVDAENKAIKFALLKQAKNIWRTKEWLPGDFVCQTAAKVQGVLYCGGYFPAEIDNSAPKTVIYRVDPEYSLKEVKVPSSLDKKRHCFTLVNLGNSLCCVGGEHEPLQKHNCSKNVFRLVEDHWEMLPDMNHARKLPGAVSVGDYLIVAGGMGNDCKPKLTIEILDIFHPTEWLEVGTLPEGTVYPQILIINDQLIAGADRDLTGVTKKYFSQKVYSRPLYELHQAASKVVAVRGGPEVQGWSEFPLLPKSGSALTNFNSQLLSFGGLNPTSIFGTCKQAYILNESKDKWIQSGEVRSFPCTGLFAFSASGPNEDSFQVVGILDTRRLAFYFGPFVNVVKKLMYWFFYILCMSPHLLFGFSFIRAIFQIIWPENNHPHHRMLIRGDHEHEQHSLFDRVVLYTTNNIIMILIILILIVCSILILFRNRKTISKFCKNRRSIDVCEF